MAYVAVGLIRRTDEESPTTTTSPDSFESYPVPAPSAPAPTPIYTTAPAPLPTTTTTTVETQTQTTERVPLTPQLPSSPPAGTTNPNSTGGSSVVVNSYSTTPTRPVDTTLQPIKLTIGGKAVVAPKYEDNLLPGVSAALAKQNPFKLIHIAAGALLVGGLIYFFYGNRKLNQWDAKRKTS